MKRFSVILKKNCFGGWGWGGCVACRILVPRPGIEPGPPAVEAQGPNHWTTREYPILKIFKKLMWPLKQLW